MRSHLQSRIPFSRHLQVRVFRSCAAMYTGVPSPAKAGSLRDIRLLATEVLRKKVLKISQSLAHGAMLEGGLCSNWWNKSSTVTFSTGAAFFSLSSGFGGFTLGGWTDVDRFLLPDNQRRLWKS